MVKIAYLFGLNYSNTKNELHGCHNDVENMNIFLKQKGWLTFVYKDNDFYITRKFVLSKLLELILTDAEEIFFHYSGHGSYIKDLNNDEEDNKDEGIVVFDENRSDLELVTDDEIKGILCCAQKNQKLYLFFDCCHSGTIGDLCYNLYKKWNGSGGLTLIKDGKQNETNAEIIIISGCLDNQTSCDAFISNIHQGACTRSFLDCYKENITWEQIIYNMQKYMIENKYSQIPTLSSGKYLNLKTSIKL